MLNNYFTQPVKNASSNATTPRTMSDDGVLVTDDAFSPEPFTDSDNQEFSPHDTPEPEAAPSPIQEPIIVEIQNPSAAPTASATGASATVDPAQSILQGIELIGDGVWRSGEIVADDIANVIETSGSILSFFSTAASSALQTASNQLDEFLKDQGQEQEEQKVAQAPQPKQPKQKPN